MGRKLSVTEVDVDASEDASIREEVRSDLDNAKDLAKRMEFSEVKSGDWFVKLLMQVVSAYNRNARAEYFQKKYPGLPRDDIADILISVAVRYAAVTGLASGAAATTSQIATLSSAGMTAALFLTTIGAEMLCLAAIQMRLVLDLSVVYDLQLDSDDPEDMLMIFGYALGIAPVNLAGHGLAVAAGAGTKSAIRQYVSKGTLKTIQDFGRRVGIKILQRTIIKYLVPIASAGIGCTYNYITTRSVGKIAKSHFRSRGEVTDELRQLVSRQNKYGLNFPAAVMHMAQIDGQVSADEIRLYRAMLSRMAFEDHDPTGFKKLAANKETVLEGISSIEDDMKQDLVNVLGLMAICDGNLSGEERQFLSEASKHLGVPLDLNELEQHIQDNRQPEKKNLIDKAASEVGAMTTGTVGVVGQAVGNLRDATAIAGGKVSGAFTKISRLKRREQQEESESSHNSTNEKD